MIQLVIKHAVVPYSSVSVEAVRLESLTIERRKRVKRQARKLTLCKETLRRLEGEQLKQAAGGTTNMCPTGDAFTCGCETGTNCQISFCICQ